MNSEWTFSRQGNSCYA